VRLPRHPKARRNYVKVLLAVHWLADEEGLSCSATNAEIAACAGLSAETVKSCLFRLESDRVVAWAADQCPGRRRILVFLDHPDAGDFVSPDRRPRSEREPGGEIPSDVSVW
jgi:hypothetical protein